MITLGGIEWTSRAPQQMPIEVPRAVSPVEEVLGWIHGYPMRGEEDMVLLRFRVANLRSLREELELSFVVPPDSDAANARTVVLSDGKELSVYPLLGIFGANASGKSNVLSALTWMRDAVLNSYAQWTSYQGIPREAFALDPKAAAETTFCEVDFVLADGIRRVYGFELGSSRVEAEWLFAYPKGRKQTWFERDASRPQEFDFPNKRIQESARLARTTRPNALMLSQAATDNHPQLTEIYQWFRGNLWAIDPEAERSQRESFTAQQLQDDGSRARVEELLQVADLGIVGTDVVPNPEGRTPQVRLLHLDGAQSDSSTPLDWKYESYGTRSWFALIGPLLLALDQGAVLLIDELDASLHPRFAAEVVRLFQSPSVNARGAQLVFTAHDPSLLRGQGGLRLLEPGQAWLTEKDERGSTSMFPLSDLEPTATEDLMMSYLEGAFGGVPKVTEGKIGRRLLAATAYRARSLEAGES